jgi:ligand-binding sensor domain-containing protein/signal transduction histidine kinase
MAAWWLLCGWGSARHAAAATALTPRGAPYTIDVWDTEDGLPQNSVIAVTQTRDGYLWLGTLNGLVRFDGRRFYVFDESNTPGLNSSRIARLFEDSRGQLWIGTESGGIAALKQGQITSLGIGQFANERRLAAACEDRAGAVWLYTASGELWRHASGTFTPFLFAWGREDSRRLLAAEAGGPVWIGTDRRLAALSTNQTPGSLEPRFEQEAPVQRLDFLLASDKGGVWRLADMSVQKWRGNRLERNLGAYPWRSAPVSAACEDRQGSLIVGTLGLGVYWFGPDGQAAWISTQHGLSSDVILSLCVDREGSLWVGTDGGGLNRVKRQVFETIVQPGRMAIQSVCDDGEGGVWIGSNGGGIMHWAANRPAQYGRNEGLTKMRVWSVLLDRDKRLWAGTYGGGLLWFDNGRFRAVPGAESLPQEITALHQDRQGIVWAGTTAGLARWDGQAWQRFTTTNGLSANGVTAIADDPDGNLWVGTTGGGLNRLRNGQFTAFRKSADGLPSDELSCLHADADGVLWVGTFGSGLARHEKGHWTRYTTRQGLASNGMGYFLEDAQGYLWIGSNSGLMRVPKKALNDYARGAITLVPCRTYGKSDGLPTGECTIGSQPAACRARDGRLWFPTIKGLVTVNPAQLSPNLTPPPVMIESVLLNGLPVKISGLTELTVPPGPNRLEINYTSLNLGAPDRASFRYRLENHEPGWNEAGNGRVARYSSLLPGRYQFQVVACNEDGVWNNTGASLALVVPPPFWQTWWFLTSVGGGLLTLIIVVVRHFSTQRLQRQVERFRQQEAVEQERSRIARDIHDQLGASLTQVALLGELVESDKDLPAEVESHARQISQTARDTTRVLDEIVWTVNPANDTLEGLANYLCKYVQDYLGVAGIRYRLEVPPDLPPSPLPPEVRHNVFLAAKEAITNIARHAAARSAWMALRLEPGVFVIEIADDGRGLAGLDEKAQTRNGLRNMRKRMEDIGGEFFLGPRPEGGAVVRFTVPLN